MRFIMNEWEEKSFNQKQALPKLDCALFVWSIFASTSGFGIEDLIQRGVAQPNEVRRACIIPKTEGKMKKKTT